MGLAVRLTEGIVLLGRDRLQGGGGVSHVLGVVHEDSAQATTAALLGLPLNNAACGSWSVKL